MKGKDMEFWILIFLIVAPTTLIMYRRGVKEDSEFLKELAIGILVLGILMVLAAIYRYRQGLPL